MKLDLTTQTVIHIIGLAITLIAVIFSVNIHFIILLYHPSPLYYEPNLIQLIFDNVVCFGALAYVVWLILDLAFSIKVRKKGG